MIFCFVRETKQLTLEELDRKWKLTQSSILNSSSHMWQHTNISRRGLLSPNQEIYPLRTNRVAPLVYQGIHLPPEYPKASSHHCYGRGGFEGEEQLESLYEGFVWIWGW
jgi:hypothetical protein